MTKRFGHPLNNRAVRITDPLFGHYVTMISEKVLPHQWDILNDRVELAPRSHCLENFRIAAGEKQGIFFGEVFQDTDVYKWLEAVSYCIESGRGEHFTAIADEVIDLISRAQQPDGYLNTYYTLEKPEERWTNLVEGHELYNAGYLIEAAVAYFNATGKRTLLKTAIRFADLITDTFGTGENQIPGYPGHQEIELALVRLYRVTGEKKYLDTASYFIRQRGSSPNYFLQEIEKREGVCIFPEFQDYDLKYGQAHTPPVEQRSIEGHAVRAMYMCAAMADLAMEYQDQDLLEACKALWESTTEKRMFVTGGIGSSGFLERFTTDYDLPNDSNYCESCASVGLMMFGQRMASLTGESFYYEAVEAALHNTILAGINADGQRYFYVNPLEVVPGACLPATDLRHIKPVRQDWFNVACCPTNLARTLASLGQYIYAIDDNTLYINQFISSEVSSGADCNYNLLMEADLTGKGQVRIKTDAPAALRIRIPRYAERPVFLFNDERIEPLIERGYAVINLNTAGELVFKMKIEPRWVAANDRVRSDAGKITLMFGPYAYCLEETDNSDRLSKLAVAPGTKPEVKEPIASLPGNLPALEYDGFRLESGVKGLYGAPDYTIKPARITAIPYGLWCNREPGEMLVWQRVRI